MADEAGLGDDLSSEMREEQPPAYEDSSSSANELLGSTPDNSDLSSAHSVAVAFVPVEDAVAAVAVEENKIENNSDSVSSTLTFGLIFCLWSLNVWIFSWWLPVMGAGMIQHGEFLAAEWSSAIEPLDSSPMVLSECYLTGASVWSKDSAGCGDCADEFFLSFEISLNKSTSADGLVFARTFAAVSPWCPQRPFPNAELGAESCALSDLFSGQQQQFLMTVIAEKNFGLPTPCYAPRDRSLAVPWQSDRNLHSAQLQRDARDWIRSRYTWIWVLINPSNSPTLPYTSRYETLENDSIPSAQAYRAGGIALVICSLFLICLLTSVLTWFKVGANLANR